MHLHKILHSLWQLTLLFVLALEFVSSLRDVRVKIPHAVRRGEKATLKCLYDLEGDSLYSVKWYKGRREFYSFTPKDTPAMKVFQFTGVKVERATSNESQLVLEAVNLATTGKYSCEVSADAPSFHTLISADELEVVEVPGKDPIITGIRPRYRIGDIVRGNCTSRHSKPAANLTWTINGYETNPSHIRHHKPMKEARELETAVSGIHFVVTAQHFIYGKLKIRCTAHIHDVYWKSTEKSIEEERHKHNSINLVNTFSEDYFDLEDSNILERSDTYVTNIKGDVSSLNSGASWRHSCISNLPHYAAILLVLFGLQKILPQLWQQLYRCDSTGVATTTIRTKKGSATEVTLDLIVATSTTNAVNNESVSDSSNKRQRISAMSAANTVLVKIRQQQQFRAPQTNTTAAKTSKFKRKYVARPGSGSIFNCQVLQQHSIQKMTTTNECAISWSAAT